MMPAGSGGRARDVDRRQVLRSGAAGCGTMLAHAVLGSTGAGSERAIAQAGNDPPSARITFSTSAPSPGEPVTFDAAGSEDPDGEIVAYSWVTVTGDDEVGAQIGTQERIEYTFEDPGIYTIGLQVRDDDGATDRDGVRVNVGGSDTAPDRGFFTNTGTDPAWLADPVPITLLGVLISVLGLLHQLLRGR